MKKILLVFGTRPEAIKMAPLVKQLQRDKVNFITKVCVTAQHRGMLDQVLEVFDITPDYDLDIMKSRQTLSEISSLILEKLAGVLNDFNPSIVLVHGDTTTSFIAALSAYYHQIKVAHVEAGLRTNNIYSPWPEEANRQLTSMITNYHFAPTEKTKKNLIAEGKQPENILVTGNTVIDALLLVQDKINKNNNFKRITTKKIEKSINCERFNLENSQFILVTAHRRENHGEGIIKICTALKEIAIANPLVSVVYPVHLNPNIQEPVKRILSNLDNVYLIKPLPYECFCYLMDKAYLIVTDSGGIQEEAPSLGTPVLVTRETTERSEALKSGTIKLVGVSVKSIKHEIMKLINDREAYTIMSNRKNPYGDGKASEKIIKFLKSE